MLSDEEFNAAYEQYGNLVHRCIMRVVNNRAVADDLMQESFIRFLQKADSSRATAHKSFLFQISHNLAVDYLKKHSRVADLDSVPERPDERDHIRDTDYKMLREDMISHMVTEDAAYLQIFLLRIDYGMTYDEIAVTLGISKRSVMRYKEQLKTILSKFL